MNHCGFLGQKGEVLQFNHAVRTETMNMAWHEDMVRAWLLRRQRNVWVLDVCPQIEGAN